MSGNDWKRGLERLKPGVYVDKAGALHIDTGELLRADGYAVNEHNMRMIARAAAEIAPQYSSCQFHIVEEYVCARCGAPVSDPAKHTCEGEVLG